jgi:hypothetical protein
MWNKDKFSNFGVQTKEIDMTDFGGGVCYIKKITLSERSNYVSTFQEDESIKGMENVKEEMKISTLFDSMAYLIAICIVDCDGNKIFDQTNAKDLEVVSSLPSDMVDYVYMQCSNYNKLGADIKDEAKNS